MVKAYVQAYPTEILTLTKQKYDFFPDGKVNFETDSLYILTHICKNKLISIYIRCYDAKDLIRTLFEINKSIKLKGKFFK